MWELLPVPGGRTPEHSAPDRLPGSTQRGGRGLASAPGAQHTLRSSSRAGLHGNQGLLGHLADHVVEDAAVVEISELHVGVKPHDGLEGLPGVQLRQQRSGEESLGEEGRQLSQEALVPPARSPVTREWTAHQHHGQRPDPLHFKDPQRLIRMGRH